MPRPPVIRAFFFMFPDDEDFGEIIDLVRPLKLNNVVPSLIKVTSDLYALWTEVTYPFKRTGGLTPRRYGIGSNRAGRKRPSL
jgi:4-cresol dehydrogenase (hydroxylating)